MTRFLARQGIDCKCGHAARQHENESGTCKAQDTRYMLRKTNRGLPCACNRYRPSLTALMFELWP